MTPPRAPAKDALPESALGDAGSYARNPRTNLTRSLEDGRLPLDTDASERAVRGVAVGCSPALTEVRSVASRLS